MIRIKVCDLTKCILLIGLLKICVVDSQPAAVFQAVDTSSASNSASHSQALFSQWGAIRSLLPHLARALSTFAGPGNVTPSLPCMEVYMRTR